MKNEMCQTTVSKPFADFCIPVREEAWANTDSFLINLQFQQVGKLCPGSIWKCNGFTEDLVFLQWAMPLSISLSPFLFSFPLFFPLFVFSFFSFLFLLSFALSFWAPRRNADFCSGQSDLQHTAWLFILARWLSSCIREREKNNGRDPRHQVWQQLYAGSLAHSIFLDKLTWDKDN